MEIKASVLAVAIASATILPGQADAQRSSSTVSGALTRATKKAAQEASFEAAATATLARLGYTADQVASTRFVSLDLGSGSSNMLEALPDRIEILGKSLRRTQQIGAPADLTRYVLYRSESRTDWANFEIHQDGAVNGYANIDGRDYDFVPAQKALKGKANLLAIQLQPFRDEDVAVQSDRPSGALWERTWTGCDRLDAITVAKPLTVLFGYTPAAARNAQSSLDGRTGIPPLVNFALMDLRAALRDAGIDAPFAAPGLVEVQYVESKVPDGRKRLDDALFAVTDGQDPAMVRFRERRKQTQADIGILIIDPNDASNCGKANILPSGDRAFAVVNWRCMRHQLSAQHEIGHLLGLHHDDDDTAEPAFSRAFVHPDHGSIASFVTIMGNKASCPDCYRALKFSNPFDAYSVPGIGSFPIGEKNRIDNACLLRKTFPLAVEYGEHL